MEWRPTHRLTYAHGNRVAVFQVALNPKTGSAPDYFECGACAKASWRCIGNKWLHHGCEPVGILTVVALDNPIAWAI